MPRLAPLALAALAAGGATAPPEAPVPEPARARFEALEARLLAARSLRVEGYSTTTGAVRSQFRGGLRLGAGNRVDLAYQGRFEGAPVALRLFADPAGMQGGNGAAGFQGPTPEHLGQGLVLGLLRMGITHNLAVLSGGKAPHGTDGEASTWLAVDGFRLADTEPGEPERLEFQVTVGGQVTADATLWLDPETGLPVRRDQRVPFGEAVMHAVEAFEVFEVIDP